jgi:hypothetical protein
VTMVLSRKAMPEAPMLAARTLRPADDDMAKDTPLSVGPHFRLDLPDYSAPSALRVSQGFGMAVVAPRYFGDDGWRKSGRAPSGDARVLCLVGSSQRLFWLLPAKD